MNRYTLFIISVAIFFYGYTSQNVWVDSNMNLSENWRWAISQKKPVFLYFYADWCGACQKTSPVISSLAEDYSQQYTYLAVNIDNDKNKELLKAFKISAIPRIYIFNPKTNKTHRIPNYTEKQAFENEMVAFLEN